jgi:hypothetical protein
MPSTATAPRQPSLPAKPPGPPPAPLIPAKRSGSALKLARWTFTKPSAKNADKRARKMAAKKPMSAAETFINVAELRRQCLRYLDNADLARMIRVRKDLVHDVAQVLYAKVGWELVRDKLCRKKVCRVLACICGLLGGVYRWYHGEPRASFIRGSRRNLAQPCGADVSTRDNTTVPATILILPTQTQNGS